MELPTTLCNENATTLHLTLLECTMIVNDIRESSVAKARRTRRESRQPHAKLLNERKGSNVGDERMGWRESGLIAPIPLMTMPTLDALNEEREPNYRNVLRSTRGKKDIPSETKLPCSLLLPQTSLDPLKLHQY